MNEDSHPIVDEILELFRRKGDSQYGGECVTQLEHALQTATLAESENTSPELITAALLHDIGHLLHELPDCAPDAGIDDVHERVAFVYLNDKFPLAVTEPAGLHVDAKRYLCAVESGYFESLSQPSVVSLRLQGGPMMSDEQNRFRLNSCWKEAVRLRRWDDAAKLTDQPTPPIEHFAEYLRQAVNEKVDT